MPSYILYVSQKGIFSRLLSNWNLTVHQIDVERWDEIRWDEMTRWDHPDWKLTPCLKCLWSYRNKYTVEIWSPSSQCVNYLKAHLKLQSSFCASQFPSSQWFTLSFLDINHSSADDWPLVATVSTDLCQNWCIKQVFFNNLNCMQFDHSLEGCWR